MGFVSVVLTTLCLLGASQADAAKIAPLQVGFLPPSGLSDSTARANANTALNALISKIGTDGGYLSSFSACLLEDKPATQNPCLISATDVVVTTSFGSPAVGGIPVTMTAGTLRDQHQTGQLSFTVIDTQSSTLTAAFTGLESELDQLLGTPSLSNGTLSLSGYSPFLQLVPETATDRKYVGILGHMLASKRIQSVPSQFTGIDISPGASSAGSICQASPRYLHYSVEVQQKSRPLEFRTVVTAIATGNIIDCANPAIPLTFQSTAISSIPATKGSFASVIGILTLAFLSKTNSWGNTGSVATSLAGFIDIDPSSLEIEQDIYYRSLNNLVGDMCLALANASSIQQQNLQQNRLPPGSSPPTAQTVLGSTTNTLGIGDLLVPKQPPLACSGS